MAQKICKNFCTTYKCNIFSQKCSKDLHISKKKYIFAAKFEKRTSYIIAIIFYSQICTQI